MGERDGVSMADFDDWTSGVNVKRASVARVYDFMLGGTHNFPVDRELGELLNANYPASPGMARANRAFLGRAVRYLAEQGVRQFLDIGSGIPTMGNVHEVAQRVAPEARVLYVDIEVAAVMHSIQMLAGNGFASAVEGDLRRPHELLQQITTNPELASIIDLGEPTALLLVQILPFIPDPYDAVAVLRDALPPGSYVAISHSTNGGFPDDVIAAAQELYERQTGTALHLRSREEVLRLFGGFTLVDPGLVWTPDWRPDGSAPDDLADESWRASIIAGVGIK
jgi:hypothetical protein